MAAKIYIASETVLNYDIILFFSFLVMWMKNCRDITAFSRTIKEVSDDYTRFSIKECELSDDGIYTVVAKNKHGIDKCMCRLTVILVIIIYLFIFCIFAFYLLFCLFIIFMLFYYILRFLHKINIKKSG